ncbi:MAG: heme lyase CcmF/NrfE family subunit [Alphaproteobacteria bacterium]
MIVEIGHYALVLALFVALTQGSLPLVGAQTGNAAWMALARPAAIAQFALIAIAFLALMQAYVTSDFSVVNVVRNSHSAKPLLYKISGTWGNHEGSMLLWVLILAAYGLMVALFGRNLPTALRARVLAVQALIAVGFLLFLLLTSNPFERVFPAPADGNDLNPLLQDPGLAFHPPFLYLGYVGFSMAFAFAIAALISGRVDPAWARWVRPWTLVAWCALTVGVVLGSWWAYYELGWGGWWFWDPVENASLMPWIAGTALLHSAIVVEKRDALKNWTVLLAILAFALSLIGTFLVRSGVLTSVHAFATDPARGLFILFLLIVIIGGALTLYAWRAPALKQGGLFAPVSREGGLVLNNLLLSAGLATVFIGTLYPLFLDAVGGGKISVGAPFFTATFVPLMVPMVVAMGIGPMLAWKRGDLAGALGRLKFVFALTLVAALAAWYIDSKEPVLAVLGIGLAAWLFFATLADFTTRIKLFGAPPLESWRRARRMPRAAYGMTLAHAGLAIAIAGMTGSIWNSENVRAMRIGDTARIAGYDLTLEAVDDVRGPNYSAERARFAVRRDGRAVATMHPERRLYPVQGMPTTEAAIRSTWRADLYAVIGEGDGQGTWTVRLYHNPLVPWMWTGAAVMVLGGLVSLSDRRLRIGAPTRRRRRPKTATTAKAGH